MKVGARAPDLRLRVSAGSAEQIHFSRRRCPCARAVLSGFGGEQLSPPSGWRCSYFLARGSVQKQQTRWKERAQTN